jgi:hypothetical protein
MAIQLLSEPEKIKDKKLWKPIRKALLRYWKQERSTKCKEIETTIEELKNSIKTKSFKRTQIF